METDTSAFHVSANIADVRKNCQLFLIDPTELTEGDTKKTIIYSSKRK